MSNIKDGGPAFPETFCVGPNDDMYPAVSGMTLRTYIAIAAMQGDIAASAGTSRPQPDDVAAYSIQVADALMKALDEEK